MGKGSSRGFHPSGLPGFLGICCLIALVLSGIDIFLGSGSGHLLPDLSVVIPAMSIFAVLLTACALGLSLPILLYGRWSGGRPVSWRAGETLFVFIVVYLFIEYHLMGELVGWADLDASGIHLSPHIHLREEATAFIVASMSATLAYYLMSRFFRSLIALLLAAAILLPMLAGRASSRRHTGRGGGRGNVILVTIDTLRADFLGCYGSEHARTPFIDSLARGGILFERAYTASSLTGPSHASLMTSLYPRSHGLLYNGWSIDPAIETLPRILRSAGYRTGAIIHALPLDRKYGFERGFDYFLSAYKEETFTLAVLERTQLLSLIYDQPHRRGGHVIELASSWLRRYSGEPFFLWIHLYDVHEPYSPPAGFVDPAIAGARYPEAVAEGRADPTEANIERLRGLYSGEVRYVDYLLGELWGLLQRLGSTEGTCLVVTSDHGEELLDHGSNVGHARFLYRSVCHVPLIIGSRSPQDSRHRPDSRHHADDPRSPWAGDSGRDPGRIAPPSPGGRQALYRLRCE
jgi:arylsulfatase A-like enzyme